MKKETSDIIAQCRLSKLYSAFFRETDLVQHKKPESSRFAKLFASNDQRTIKSPSSRSSSIDKTENTNSDSSFNARHQLAQPIQEYQTQQQLNQYHKNQQRNYDLNIYDLMLGKETKTTVMMKNIPNKFNRKRLIDIIDGKFKGKFDLVYLPIDCKLKKNYGFAFINLTSSLAVIEFYSVFNGEKWLGTNSEKICEVTYSKLQGREKMLKHFPIKAIYAADTSILYHHQCKRKV